MISRDKDITFTVNKIKVYGSIRLPKNSKNKVPGAVILSGSGPTDRNGNSSISPYKNVNTNKWISVQLSKMGYASIRYDKFLSGKTGLGPYVSNPSKLKNLKFNIYIQEAMKAFMLLSNQPGIDKTKILIIGHSEGCMIALVANKLLGNSPMGLILLEPQYDTILPILFSQMQYQINNDKKVTSKDKKLLTKWLNLGIKNIKKLNYQKPVLPLPFTSGQTAVYQTFIKNIVFNEYNYSFLHTENKYNPVVYAKSVSNPNSVLITCGTKDINTPCKNVKILNNSFKKDVSKLIILQNTNHVLRNIGNKKATEKINTFTKYPYSKVLITEFNKFLRKHK